MLANCDVTLPTGERYASSKFRRFSRITRVYRLTVEDQLELALFLRIVPMRWARIIFQWDDATVRHLKRCLICPLPAYVDAQAASLTLEDGLAVLQALHDAGWKRSSKLPKICRMAIIGLRDAGLSYPKIASVVGLSQDQVAYVCVGRPERRRITSRGRAAAAVSVG
jgi:hypothetical protein